MSELLISEVYGPVFQGEGRQRGQLSAFVRLGGCNLACSWCDTPYAVFFDHHKAQMHQSKKAYDPTVEMSRRTPEWIAEYIADCVPVHTTIIFSGGEPLLQASNIVLVLQLLYNKGYHNFAFETAGTIWPTEIILWALDHQVVYIQWNVSPKLTNSGNAFARRYKEHVLLKFASIGADFKFVVSKPADIVEVDDMVDKLDLNFQNVWIMPEGTDPLTILGHARDIASIAVNHGYNLTLRDHVLLFGNERLR